MKKQILFASLACAVVSTSMAQPEFFSSDEHASVAAATEAFPAGGKHQYSTEKNNLVSYQTHEAFLADFREAENAIWFPGADMDRVEFTLDGKQMTAYYDPQSDLIGTTTPKTMSDLPARARKEISLRYPGFTPADVIYFDDNSNNETAMMLYDNSFKDESNYFVQMKDGPKEVILQVSLEGNVSMFKDVK